MRYANYPVERLVKRPLSPHDLRAPTHKRTFQHDIMLHSLDGLFHRVTKSNRNH